MAYDGNGNYILPSPEFPFIPNTTIEAEAMNNVLADMGQALSRTLLKDGGNSPTQAISWNEQKITGLGAGTLPGDAVNYGQVFNGGVFTAPTLSASPAFDASNGLLVPTLEWVRNLSFQSALPGQTPAKAGFFLQTDGTDADFVTIDGRGVSYLGKGNSGAVVETAVVYSPTAESQRLNITGQTRIAVSGFPADRTTVMLLTLINAGLFPPTWAGVVWLTPAGVETTDFALTGVTWQSNGRDRVVICAEPGVTPWARVVR